MVICLKPFRHFDSCRLDVTSFRGLASNTEPGIEPLPFRLLTLPNQLVERVRFNICI